MQQDNNQRLWAPWRMEYVTATKVDGCFLCQKLSENDDKKNFVLKRGKECAVVLNLYPYNNGHLLIAPYRHIANLNELTVSERSELMELTIEMTNILNAVMNPKGFNIGLNLGESAGAGLKDHLHLHIVPRWPGDTNFMSVIGQTKVIPQSLEDLWQKLKAQINNTENHA